MFTLILQVRNKVRLIEITSIRHKVAEFIIKYWKQDLKFACQDIIHSSEGNEQD